MTVPFPLVALLILVPILLAALPGPLFVLPKSPKLKGHDTEQQ